MDKQSAKMNPKTSSKKINATSIVKPIITVDPTECPFREFRDNELQPEYWGMGPSAFRAYSAIGKGAGLPKPPPDYVWADDQTQPLPRSVRQYLHGYVRAEELASCRWEADVVVFEENNGSKMSMADVQLSHAQVLNRSSFCRKVLSACFILERAETCLVEHQWENFNFTFGPEGWRAKYHIYSPGMKAGGGSQHRPTLSRNGCYLVRLYHLGAWRCVWVTDQVPVDATDAPLLPFSPLLCRTPASKLGKQVPTTVTSGVVFLWPLLICKALLKLAAPNMNSDENSESVDDELMPEFDVMHALTGAMNMNYDLKDEENLWELITKEVPLFSWDDDDETQASTMRSKSTKKATAKDVTIVKKGSMVYLIIIDTKEYPPFFLPGITPGFEMSLFVSMARDVPLKKPLPEPEVPLWKTYRWVHWARTHGLYEAYECPRTRYLKVNGLLKLSFAPHLLDVLSTESLTVGFVKAEQSVPAPSKDKRAKDSKVMTSVGGTNPMLQQLKEELREWILFKSIQQVIKTTYVLYYPSMYECASAASCPPVRVTKGLPSKHSLDVSAPKAAPLYFQIDGPETNTLKISLNVLHPRILSNAGVFIMDYVESGYLVLERFEWFEDCELPKPKAYVRTCGYDAVEVSFVPGRHFCRIWVHSRMNWHIMLLSESTMQLGPRDQIQCAAVRECPWASKFLQNLGSAFSNWVKVGRSSYSLRSVQTTDRDFFKSYLPDLEWDSKITGYHRSMLHWMFRQALQSHLFKRLAQTEWATVFNPLRRYFRDPDFGFPPKPLPPTSLKDIADRDPCDCLMPEVEETEINDMDTDANEEQEIALHELEKPLVPPEIMDNLLKPPKPPVASNICEFATEEIPCGVLKEERSKVIRKHVAATTLQAHWRGTWARKCLNNLAPIPPDAIRILQDTVFGNQESLSSLMKEFFLLYPGTKYSYSVSSALSGIYGLHQHHGTSQVTAKCKWIPYFQGVFYCHSPCKVHFDVSGSLTHSTVEVYDNDNGAKLPQAYNAHKTFDFIPNIYGYTVLGHGSINEPSGIFFDVHWQLTVLSSLDGAFHICNNEDDCRESPLSPAIKLHIDEIFIPNRRNILGGIQLSVTRHEAVSFRAAATSPDLQMVAKLRTMGSDGKFKELGTCSGKGEIYWPYIRLQPSRPINTSTTALKLAANLSSLSARNLGKVRPKPGPTRHTKSTTKLKTLPPMPAEPKQYFIEVVAPSGWPLTIGQWKRVDEVRNSTEFLKFDTSPKRVAIKEKTTVVKTAKDKPEKIAPAITLHQPHPGDAYVELECSLAVTGGIIARRDEEREMDFAEARRSWEEYDHGRNKRGAQIRKEFRDEFLEAPPAPPESYNTTTDDLTNYDGEGENLYEDMKKSDTLLQGPTPATESGMIEMSVEEEEEIKYLTMPEQLRDKFVPLDFVPLCTKEKSEDACVVLTPDMTEAAKQGRHARIDAAEERMRELQQYNELQILGRQKERHLLLERLYVDYLWPPRLQEVLEHRNEAIVQETLLRSLSATKKKQEQKVKK